MKMRFIIPLGLSLFVGYAIFDEIMFGNLEPSIFLLIPIIGVYFFSRGFFSFFHKIGKDAAKISRKEGAKYEKTLDAEYIRELPNYYTPALVSFVQDQAVEYNKDVLATILHLINNGYLKMENEMLAVEKKNIDNLYEHEKYIYESIQTNSKVMFSVYKGALTKDAYKLGLLKRANNSNLVGKGIFRLFGRFFYPAIAIFSLPLLFNLGTIGICLMVVVILSIPVMVFRGFGKGISYLIAAGTRTFDLTDKGKMDQEKIYMFKNFLKEFTSLDKKSVIDIHLWDEYLTYALVLEVNKKIYEDEKLKYIVNRVQEIIISDYKNDVLS